MSADGSPDDVKVAGLFSYPVKSCRAVAHARAQIAITGLPQDRTWMLVDPRRSPGQFITQRECPALATIAVDVRADGSLAVSCASGGEMIVPSPPVNALVKVKVWRSELVALDAGEAASAWFANALSLPASAVRLVQFHQQQVRQCNAFYAGDSGAHTFFADGYPLLVTNEASLADLNRRIGRNEANALPMNRFRPNLVLAGLAPWDEDFVDEITLGKVVLKLVKPCVRCVATTTDQSSGARLSDEPINTLARFRNNPDLGGVTFGWNAVVLRAGEVARGDQVVVSYRF